MHQIHPDCSYKNSFLELEQRLSWEAWFLGSSLTTEGVNMLKVKEDWY